MGHLEYRVSRQERTTEWIAVKPVKQESKSLTHFFTTIYCYEIDSILMSQLLSKHILHVNNNQHFGRDERRETASTSCRGLWVLFDVQMAFHDCKYNIFTFSFFHLFLIFEIKCQIIFCRYINTWGGALCGKLSDACKGGTSSSGEQSKDVCKATQHLLHHQTVFLHPHAHSQEKPVGGQPEYQGLYSSLFGIVIIHHVGSFIVNWQKTFSFVWEWIQPDFTKHHFIQKVWFPFYSYNSHCF